MKKDHSLHELIERTARAGAEPPPPGGCLDAETLAAWTDGSLTAQERAVAETHVADCDRCLAMLAAVAKTEPPPSASPRAHWFSVRWLVPLTTAAVVATGWMLVQGLREPVTPAAPPAQSRVDSVSPAEPAGTRDSKPSRQAADAFQDKSTAPPNSRSRDQAELRRAAPSKLEPAAREPKSAASPATPAPANQPPPPPPAVATPAPAAATPSARAEADARFQAAGRENKEASPIIVSTDTQVQWRVAGTRIERTTDSGRTWQAQAIGTTVALLAGSSPAPTVCWVVGRQGRIFLSTDGATWRRLAFPDSAIDLVGVTAQNALAATVTTADGRRFRTTDAGRTWTLQEHPATPF